MKFRANLRQPLKLNDKVQAEKWFKNAISFENSDTSKAMLMRELARKYDDEFGELYDYVKILKIQFNLLREAADLDGFEDEALAESYLHGYGTQRNISKAIQIYEQLALIDGRAAIILGGYYRDGMYDIQVNLDKARYYYKLACDDGVYYACSELENKE